MRRLQRIWTEAPRKNRILTILALSIFVVGLSFGEFLQSRFLKHYGIYFEKHTEGCLPWLFYFADRQVGTIQRGDVLLFASKGAVPLFKDGSPLVKMAMGLPGDDIEVKDSRLYINGRYWGSLKLGLRRFGHPDGYLDKKFVLGRGEYFMLGTEPRSFDSRFWGVVKRDQVRAKLHLLM